MTVHLNSRTPPAKHDRDRLIVVPLGDMSSAHVLDMPFAAVIVLDDGEDVSAKPRLCINFGVTNDQFWAGDGIFACESTCPMIICAFPFPELAKALRLTRREWWQLLNVPKNFKPYTLVKNWQEGDIVVDTSTDDQEQNFMPEEQFGPTTAWQIMKKWNSIVELDWPNRVCEIIEGAEHLAAPLFDAVIYRVQNLYKQIGLYKATGSKLNDNIADLEAALMIAQKVSVSEVDAD
jgi:hypothetical protein